MFSNTCFGKYDVAMMTRNLFDGLVSFLVTSGCVELVHNCICLLVVRVGACESAHICQCLCE